MDERVEIAAAALSERGRLRAGGECVRYTRIVIAALESAGYTVAKLERVTGAGESVPHAGPCYRIVEGE